MDLAAFLAPFPIEQFMATVYDRQPLHIRAEGEAGERRRALLPWSGLNALFGVAAQWSEDYVKLILNGHPVPPDHYLDEVDTPAGPVRRADPAKIEALLGFGASLVADSVENASIDLRRVTGMLSEAFLGTSGANAYCSFRDVQAFRTHFDLHDVFAVHCEGEKIWRIYENKAPDPVEQHGGADAAAIIEQAKGRVWAEARMRPGDLLYLPRGFYHDALASSEASLHVTFSVARHTGRILFRILDDLAMQDADFRAYLPDGRVENGEALRERLETLGAKVEALMLTPSFRNALLNRQLALAKPVRELKLPERPPMQLFARTQRKWQIIQRESGTILQWDGGQATLGLLEDAVRWFLSQSLVSLQQLVAHFPQYGEPALADLVALLQRAGLVEPRNAVRA